jgi:hypothetical protein
MIGELGLLFPSFLRFWENPIAKVLTTAFLPIRMLIFQKYPTTVVPLRHLSFTPRFRPKIALPASDFKAH